MQVAERLGDEGERWRPSSDREKRRRLASKHVNNAVSSNPKAPPPPFEPPDALPDEPPLVAATTATDTWLCADELRESVQVTVYVKFPTVLAVWLAVPDMPRLPDHGEPFAPPLRHIRAVPGGGQI